MKKYQKVENKMETFGFNKLQEKEKMVYFEKHDQNESVYLVYDMDKKRVHSMDTYEISEDGVSIKEVSGYKRAMEELLKKDA